MNSRWRALGTIAREITEDICVWILPVKWIKSYLDRQLDSCDVLRVDRRALLLTKMMLVANRAGDLGSAEKAARDILSINPDDPWTPIELAMILEKQGRYSEAKQLYQRISEEPHLTAPYRAKASSEVERLTALERR